MNLKHSLVFYRIPSIFGQSILYEIIWIGCLINKLKSKKSDVIENTIDKRDEEILLVNWYLKSKLNKNILMYIASF